VWEHEVCWALPDVLKRILGCISGKQSKGDIGWRVVKADPVPRSDRVERWELRHLADPQQVVLLERERSTTKAVPPRAVRTQ
jgi:hypothetical protein